mmetsp:Transcript_38772/g.50173  ORF Transcript_38772/g.50173 Transcript_38772/m.50173 type:complete len:88 (+) Transcript_38772:313-576(+)|eukprot:CAMPEP_0114343562 /NCGR_PEP_ID=MMETSP0101-20121206/10703_1 /TAXON_ID=38822 ORGANISM="Pteridomonas danica, Strain PT" /NCGR_SAMPLE_ID=MMETSP0101 /ASSEMBLY_ACC=CAM_ASM_000211 /LENGTH=87 /DNA_ID=CAMNT_0001478353 /DNA_START=289 /DNA_END=552 /DNA_ORIENTATION=+
MTRTIIDKDIGTVKLYPLTGRRDVEDRWKQFKQWIGVMSHYILKRRYNMHVKPEIRIVASDRGSEFMTTYDRSMNIFDQLLHDDGVS